MTSSLEYIVARIVLIFASKETAATNVAGVPAAARAAREACIAADLAFSVEPQQAEVLVVLPNLTGLDPWIEREMRRLATTPRAKLVQMSEARARPGDVCIAGELQLSADEIVMLLRHGSEGQNSEGVGLNFEAALCFHGRHGASGLGRRLAEHSRRILISTGKASDGIVSRHINRPFSRCMSGQLLRARWVRPIHATALSMITGIAMLACLISGRPDGLVVGALFFQLASMIDGIDGEIARATFRTSNFGESLDSLTDGLTNLAFLVGLSANLSLQGDTQAALLGLTGFALLAIGLLALGWRALITQQPLNFDAAKHILRRKSSRWADLLIWITMRDFLALAASIMVALGGETAFLTLFAIGAVVWLSAVILLIFINF